ncbi:MAG TPA: superoxide dismutase [Candidatus Hydrogenedens sp.]|nr:superoxide dismutase [Candidatus Hydrogenedens sp.]HOK08194.1 superoxide dismutase [Candidatus Hydrogenedens sp.]HOL20113.1 superoxide dismutase [Candidatus Hydrogenedens sp.]HPP58663.1 superoxide dismutase [Candidatus Hydrogenedens sp.]
MPFTLPNLPFEPSALRPYISLETINYHYGKHHQAYVNNLNKLIENTPLEEKTLEEIIMSSEGAVFNNSAQVWNHTFYWNCLNPQKTEPSKALLKVIEKDFESLDKMIEKLQQSAITLFGSGWAWLVNDSGTLKILQTSNADLPMKHNQTALFTIDVWEHAYYIDFRNDRPKYVQQVLNNLMNWKFIEENYEKSQTK